MSFVSQSTTVGCPLAVLQDMFEDEDGEWLVPFIRLASLEGRAEADRMHARFGRTAPARDLRKPRAEVQVGGRSVRVDPPGFSVEIRWTAFGYGHELSGFGGRIVAVPLSSGDTLLSIEGGFGQEQSRDFNDRLAERRAAESTLRSFLRLLRAAVEEAHQAVT